MKWLNEVIKKGFKHKMHKVLRPIEQPEATQEKVFKQLVEKASKTSFGKEFDLASTSNIDQLKQRIPAQSYEDLEPYIKRMMLGESNVLLPQKVSYFSRSSGTTGSKSKYIPMPLENLRKCHLKGGHDAVAIWFHNNPESKLFDSSQSIIMGGTLSQFDKKAKTYVGDVSALMLHYLPFYAVPFLSPNVATALLPDWEEKIERIAQVTKNQNISNLSGVPTWTLILFRRILELSGKDSLSEVFPNFELYAHGGVDFKPYQTQFEALFPCGTVQYRNTYNASEGFFASQFSKDDVGMQLFFDNGVFYEFVRLEDSEDLFPKTHTIGEVELGVDYSMLISTNAGLWRYKLGDTIRFTSLYPHHIEITGRTKQFINVFGEEVMVWNAEQALAKTCQEIPAEICEYTVAPIFLSDSNKGGHEWLIEFKKAPNDLKLFQQLLDKNLQNINSDYEAKRYKDIALEELRIQIVPQGTFYQWLKSKGKYGGQNKVPRLSNHRQYINEIFKFAIIETNKPRL